MTFRVTRVTVNPPHGCACAGTGLRCVDHGSPWRPEGGCTVRGCRADGTPCPDCRGNVFVGLFGLVPTSLDA